MIKTLAPLALAFSCLLSHVTGVMAQNAPPNVVKELAPNGKLRAAINFGNIVLAQKDPAGGEPRGVSAELARELAKRLSVPIEYVTFDAAGKVFDALKTGAWDVAFLAIDPVRSEGIEFTGPYVVIEGAYLVPRKKLEALRAKYNNESPPPPLTTPSLSRRSRQSLRVPIGGRSLTKVSPRFLALRFALTRLSRRISVELDVALVGVPMDLGVTNRPGARFGPGPCGRSSASDLTITSTASCR